MKNKIIEILTACGIKDVGFCNFDILKDKLLDCRAKNRLPTDAKTVIMCVFPYKAEESAPHYLSRYAAVPDYHTVVGDILKSVCIKLQKEYPQNSFRCFCDNSPIPEVFAAAVAGLGAVGDNGLLLTPKYGSFVFLGEIVTDLLLESENKYSECNHCGKCKAACPVLLDKQGCLSHISQKKKLEPHELDALKRHNVLWGCDICANACPHNKNAQITYISEFINGYRSKYNLQENAENRAYNWRGKDVIKRNYDNLVK